MKIQIETDTYYAKLDTPVLAVQGENHSHPVHITHPIVPGAEAYYLRFGASPDTLYDLLITNGIVELTHPITAASGMFSMQWIAKSFNGSLIAKSQMFQVFIEPSLEGDTSPLPTPEEIRSLCDGYIATITAAQQTYLALQQQVEEAVQNALHAVEQLEKGEISLYVDAENGSDTNMGISADLPLKTLQQAFRNAKSYRIVHLHLRKGQSYPFPDGTLQGKEIVLESYGTETAVPVITSDFILHNGSLSVNGVNLHGAVLHNAFGTFSNCSCNNLYLYNTGVFLENVVVITQITAAASRVSVVGSALYHLTAEQSACIFLDSVSVARLSTYNSRTGGIVFPLDLESGV